MKKRLFSYSLAALVSLGAFGMTAPAMASGEVVLYSANDDTVNNLVAEGFKKETGINLNVISSGSGVLFRRVASEAGNPQGDVVWGVSTALLKQNSKYFQPYAVKGADQVPESFRVPDDLWISTNIQVVTINQNTKSIPETEGPKSWSDLFEPKWKGRLAYTDPANSGFSYAIASGLIQEWGDNDDAWKKFENLVANARVLNRSTQVFDGNGSGEYPLGIALEYAGFLWANNGAPVKVTYPEDGTIVLPEGAAILKDGPNPENAQKLVDYLASKSTQEMLLKATFRRPARQDVDVTSLANMADFKTIKVMDYDAEKWGARRNEALKKMKHAIQETR